MTDSPAPNPGRPSPQTWAVLAAVGLLLALTGVLRPKDSNPSDTAASAAEGDPAASGRAVVARVADQALTEDDVLRALLDQRRSRRGEPNAEETRELIEQLVREELLIQRAATLGLLDTAPSLRRSLMLAATDEAARAAVAPDESKILAELESQAQAQGLDDREKRQLGRELARRHRQEAQNLAIESRLQELRRQIPVIYASEPAAMAGSKGEAP